MIPKDKSDDPYSASYNGGGVENEHFIVWMRAAALPRFRKLYGRIKRIFLQEPLILPYQCKYPKIVSFRIDFYVTDVEKALVLTTTNWLGGKNYFLGWSYIGVGIFCILFAIAFVIKQMTCPR